MKNTSNLIKSKSQYNRKGYNYAHLLAYQTENKVCGRSVNITQSSVTDSQTEKSAGYGINKHSCLLITLAVNILPYVAVCLKACRNMRSEIDNQHCTY